MDAQTFPCVLIVKSEAEPITVSSIRRGFVEGTVQLIAPSTIDGQYAVEIKILVRDR